VSIIHQPAAFLRQLVSAQSHLQGNSRMKGIGDGAYLLHSSKVVPDPAALTLFAWSWKNLISVTVSGAVRSDTAVNIARAAISVNT
jgi:hypothetical protein